MGSVDGTGGTCAPVAVGGWPAPRQYNPAAAPSCPQPPFWVLHWNRLTSSSPKISKSCDASDAKCLAECVLYLEIPLHCRGSGTCPLACCTCPRVQACTCQIIWHVSLWHDAMPACLVQTLGFNLPSCSSRGGESTLRDKRVDWIGWERACMLQHWTNPARGVPEVRDRVYLQGRFWAPCRTGASPWLHVAGVNGVTCTCMCCEPPSQHATTVRWQRMTW